VLNADYKPERELYYPKSGISHYDSPVNKNIYASHLEPLSKLFFADIDAADESMMQHCYVYSQGTPEVEKQIRSEIEDIITTYFKADGAVEVKRSKLGSPLTRRLKDSLTEDSSDVVILFGGKGAGKSTFLKRLFFFDQPQDLKLHSFPIIIQFLKTDQNRERITSKAWEKIVENMDLNKILQGSIEKVADLFSDRMEIAEKQDLSAYDKTSKEYKIERNKLIAEWKKDQVYVAKCLQNYWRANGKGIIIAFDNTDQLPPKLQDHCFLLAQNVASNLSCITLISMREERYCRARTMGVLDAYHNSGFHLSSPSLFDVFHKRLKFAVDTLKQDKNGTARLLKGDAPYESIIKFYSRCLSQFNDPENALTKFLRECSRDNVRMALEFFRQFTTSGYTHIQEMIASPRWTVSSHQAIKPMMVPERHNYDEDKSLIPNIFQCRTANGGSHFTGIRILRMLRTGAKKNSEQGAYRNVDSICLEFDSKFGMLEDAQECLDCFLRHGIIEANNRLDAFSVEMMSEEYRDDEEVRFIRADEFRITAFGVYLYDCLCRTFSYIELTSLDCGVSDESLYEDFCLSADKERMYAVNGNKKDRLDLRVDRANKFIEYLTQEELRETNDFLLGEGNSIMDDIKVDLDKDLKRVRKSAKRNITAISQKFGTSISSLLNDD
jgi:ABC-type lipoprotein export system ATPase subunit